MAVYIHQLDGFWKLTKAEWQAIIESALRNGDYVLPDDKQLRGQPGHIRRVITNDRMHYICVDGRHSLHTPIDWTREDWEDAEEIERAALSSASGTITP